ncbi:MAG: MarR family transcriptional regulator [Chloroflexi bacterium]|nr:MarR family transcriptional regulator [Chloroflexota bacterium]
MAIPENSQISMNDLSIKMRLANSTMTRMVDQLVQKGMVTRESDHHDRRIVLVQLTDQGTNVRKKFKEALQSLFSQVLGEILETERMDILKSLSVFNDAIIKTLKSCCEEDML